MNTSPAPSDEDLLQQARSSPEGDYRAFEQLVLRHQEKIVANCRYLTRSPGDAEDLAQEVFMKTLGALERFEGRSTFRTWIQRIKVNHCLNHIKKHSGKTFVEVDGLDGAEPEELSVEPCAERKLQADADAEKIGQTLESMSDTLRIPLVLRDMDHLAYQEIADLLGIGLSAVKMRIKRAREDFRSRFETGATVEADEAPA